MDKGSGRAVLVCFLQGVVFENLEAVADDKLTFISPFERALAVAKSVSSLGLALADLKDKLSVFIVEGRALPVFNQQRSCASR